MVNTPVVTTVHGFSSEKIIPVYEKYNSDGYYVAISDTDRSNRLDYIATIHHGIDMTDFEVGSGSGGYLLFFGRIHPDKGTAEAIEVADRIGLPLTIAGIIQDREYFENQVEPKLDGDRIRYVGPVAAEGRNALLGNARALLHLINFDEPFGFSVVEAMACGTPVIAHRRGSMAEIIESGRNGFLVDSIEEAIRAVDAAAVIDRNAVRGSVEHRFSVDRMVDQYLEVYRRIIGLRGDAPAGGSD